MALLGSVGPLTAPFFLALGLSRGAYIGTEAACALVMHAAYGAGALLTPQVLVLGLAVTPATVAGAWAGKRVSDRLSDHLFTRLVEAPVRQGGAATRVPSPSRARRPPPLR